ncbi:NPCBM/NEW2 domain-containing protein [Streptomyces sp. NPDC087866]|uniref:NPCBM/NEW2 domain-containing protein n=1 Tax=unclassified Streptomyces TaxID=2593676 RepID=UPI00225ACD18|nr:NPCBM/NEW2 domain-containing protein [Streptomyces sp. NBC_01789]MCX4444921.1 NPCBM/NEW2 domain-containing protein [Streptomyces sp. NBC_01789]
MPVPRPDPEPSPGPPEPRRRLGEIAALVSAAAAVVGLLLGFFGLPTVVDSPSARTATVTETVTATTTVTASPAEVPEGTETRSPSGQASPSANDVLLADLTPLGIAPDQIFSIQDVTMGAKPYPGAMVITYLCQSGLEYSINEKYKTLTFTAGLDDDSVAVPGRLSVIGDGKLRKHVRMQINRPQTVTIDVSGVVKLAIVPEFDNGQTCDVDGAVAAVADGVLKP